MKYKGQFKSVLRDKLYTVEIITNGSSIGTVNITLGPNSFTTEMDAGSNTIYVPVKYSSASVQVVADSYYFDMYSSTAKQNTVKLYDASNNILWAGYTSPNIYDAPYNFETESWKVEAIDGLSVLKYYDYTPVDGSLGFASFTQIINHCLETCGCYSYWHFSNSTHIYDASASTDAKKNKKYLTDNLYISEANFFNEDGDAMKMSEVLEEVCKFCGVTAVAYGQDVYFLDYDALKNASSTYKRYFKHTVGNNSAVDSSTADCSVNATLTINKDSYSSTGTNLSLDNVYSKVTVRDNLYTVKSIIPSLFEDEDLENIKYNGENDQKWNFDYTQKCMDRGDKSLKDDDDTYFYMKSRYYKNSKYDHFFYDLNGNSIPSSTPIISSNGQDSSALMELTTKTGVLFSRFNISTGKTRNETINGLEYNNFTDYLMMPINYSSAINKKRLESKSTFVKPFFMAGNAKLLVKGSLILTDRWKFPSFDVTDTYRDITGTHDLHADTSVGYFPVSDTFVGDYDGRGWWIFARGNSVSMTQNNLTLRIDIDINGNAVRNDVPFYQLDQGDVWIHENKKKHEIFYKSFDIQNNVRYEDNISEKGYVLNTGIGSSEVVKTKPIIRMYGMDTLQQVFGIQFDNPVFQNFKCPLACVFIKDFDIQAVVGHEGGKDENDTNTEYSYVIDDNYVSELGDIEFKICTYDDKQLNYSSVAWVDPDTGKYKFLKHLVDEALRSSLTTLNEHPYQCSEHMLCYKIVKQYSTPSKKLSINLFAEDIRPWTKVHESLLNTDFIVNSVSYNYYYDQATVNLVEKK